MVNMASGIARGRIPSPTAVVVVVEAALRKHGDLSHAWLVNIPVRVHIIVMTSNIHVNWRLSKQKPADQCHMTISWAQMYSLSVFIRRQTRNTAPKENIQVSLGQLMKASYMFTIWFGTSISWSSHSCQNKLSADQYHMTGHKCRSDRGRRFRHFNKLLGQAKKSKLRF